MDVPRRPGDALDQPTRHRLFDVLVDLRRPAGTEELADRVGLHPNGVRLHLERLLAAGLVVRKRPRQARGRPRDMWSIAVDARPGRDPPQAYADLGRWLAGAISPGAQSLRAIEAAGRDVGRRLAADAGDRGDTAERRMHDALASMGFQPRREAGPAGVLTYRLCNCPYRDAVHENQPVVCALHRGMTRGLLDTLAPDTELTRFVPGDPLAAGCLVELTGGLAYDDGDSTAATDAHGRRG
jgi:predicted ArsR family transcriptional regulator